MQEGVNVSDPSDHWMEEDQEPNETGQVQFADFMCLSMLRICCWRMNLILSCVCSPIDFEDEALEEVIRRSLMEEVVQSLKDSRYT